ncbi:MAG: hypothetical protein NZL96_01515 [Patescibacteria group bacterium]|nr:hypothetical protein [Patescibacteria group bacterium]
MTISKNHSTKKNIPFSDQEKNNRFLESKKITQSPTPDLPPVRFTGASEEPLDIPQETIDYLNEKNNLMKKLPLKTDYFLIDFDYSANRFTITYFEPKSTSRETFKSWLLQNYQKLKLEDFIEKN